MSSDTEQRVRLYATPSHPCSYLPGREAVTVFVDPMLPKSALLQTTLTHYGFRRSGEHVYRPQCPGCRECVSVRVPVDAFRPRRAQRRAWRANEDLTVAVMPARFRAEHYVLYERYLASRHTGGGMDDTSPRQYREFLLSPWADTLLLELRDATGIRAVAVTDRLRDGLSAVYTFFDPDLPQRSLGVYTVLRQITLARDLGLPYLYLGYWIAASPKMAYKASFRPQERLGDGDWERID